MSKTTTETKKLPSYIISSVTEKDGEKAAFFEVGAAWAHADGKGHTLQFRALPLPGTRLVLREPLPPRNGGED